MKPANDPNSTDNSANDSGRRYEKLTDEQFKRICQGVHRLMNENAQYMAERQIKRQVEDYLNPALFPLTTGTGISLAEQILIDSVDLDSLVEAQQQGEKLTTSQLTKLSELRKKQPYMKHLARHAAYALQQRMTNKEKPEGAE
jgi:hypothetical protein